jgi:hypothetical protein
MKTGFYNLKNLSTAQLRKFYKDAILLSYDSHVDKIDCSTSWRRIRTNDKTLQDMLDIISKSLHNTCVDRSVQHEILKEGEICFSTYKDPTYFLYIFVTLDNLKILTEKYKLEME